MIYANSLKQQIAIGAMDRKITIKKLVSSEENELGEVVSNIYTETLVAAHIMQNDKDENESNLQKQTVVNVVTFVIRWINLNHEDTIIYNTKEFDILNIDDTLGRKRFLKVRCKSVN